MNTPKTPLNALIVEDSENDVLLLIKELKRNGFMVDYQCVETPEALASACTKNWDIVFCDYSMPKMNGIQALEIVRNHNSVVPFIFVSGTIGEGVAVEAMRNGAQDYITKGNLARLSPAVERELKEVVNKKKRIKAETQLHYLAHYDALTGLPNRTKLMAVAADSISCQIDPSSTLALVYINIDRFKTVNEVLGYESGNMLLRQIARRLNSQMSNGHMLSRLSADEFAILLIDIKGKESIQNHVESIRSSLSECFTVNNWKLYFAASIGISVYQEDAENAEDLLRNADIATFRVKKEGGNDYRFYSSDMAVPLEDRIALDHAMREGLSRNEFIVYYQPQIDTKTGKIGGVESLVRWQRGNGEIVGPDRFIPLAEETGFIDQLGTWILSEACQQASCWLEEGYAPFRVAVNLSVRQLYDPKLPNLAAKILANSKIKPENLEFEITETAVIYDPERALGALRKLQKLGIKIALDDFGTGYSSLRHLKDYRVDVLKIDRSFIKDIPNDKDSMAITAALIAMAEKLGLEVVAEGVETQEQYEFLCSEGCLFTQGYYLSRPIPAAELVNLLPKTPASPLQTTSYPRKISNGHD